MIYYVSELETLSKIMLVFGNDEFKIRNIVGHTVFKVNIHCWKNQMAIRGKQRASVKFNMFPVLKFGTVILPEIGYCSATVVHHGLTATNHNKNPHSLS